MTRNTTRWLAAVAVLSLFAASCSGGGSGGDSAGDDPTEGVLTDGERLVSFTGAGGLKLAGTLGVPDDARGVPAVLIVPSIGSTIDRDGIQNPTQGDLLYKDLSKALTATGLVTLRYDRRGIGASKVDSGEKPTYDEMVEDARAALRFLGERVEVGRSPVAVIGHDVSGWIAMRLAATEPRVKGVALISTPARPLVDAMAEAFAASHGPASAEGFRSTVSTLVSTGRLPGPEQIAPEHQTILGQGQDDLLRGLFAADPLADAGAVDVPTLVVAGTRSATGTPADAERLAQAVGTAGQVAVVEAGPTLREVPPDRGPVAFDPNDESTHVFGARPVTPVVRVQAAMDWVTGFLAKTLKAAKL